MYFYDFNHNELSCTQYSQDETEATNVFLMSSYIKIIEITLMISIISLNSNYQPVFHLVLSLEEDNISDECCCS